jgi:hypothetical protein
MDAEAIRLSRSIASYLIGLGYDATLVYEIVRHEDD